MSDFAVEFHGITKRFDRVVANDNCSFQVRTRSIHGICGENGAGKSTILKILYGLYQPDEGRIQVRGKETSILSPHDAISMGIGMVHQHFMLVPTMPVWQNVVLSREQSLLRSHKHATLETLSELQKSFGFNLDLEAKVEDLPVGLQQQVEILKLLYRKADILVLDEPTAVLTPAETDRLLERLMHLRDQGKTILFISHKLREVFRFTDTVTVMRQGRVITTRPTAEFTPDSLAETMVGRKITTLPSERIPPQNDVRLELQNVQLQRGNKTPLRGVSFKVRAGEIVGIAGIEGNGQSELLEVLCKVERGYTGEILYDGKPLAQQRYYDLKQKGLAMIPADRHREGLVLDYSVEDCFLLGHHREARFRKGPRLSRTKIRKYVTGLLERFDVRPRIPDVSIRGLSGGNQQKAIIAREIGEPVRLLIAAHPTRGVDIGAIEFIHRQCLALRDAGAAVLIISSELDELLTLSDRILVMYDGALQGELPRVQADEGKLGLLMTGGSL